MTKEFIVDEAIRLDKFLSKKLQQTRNQVEQLINKNYITIANKKNVKTGLKLIIGQKIVVSLPQMEKKEAKEVNFDINIIYEDDYILVLNKPSGVIIHDAPSVQEATLVDWLRKYGISLSTISGEERHGIVHRLDKGTSGAIVVAKTNEAHVKLSKQLEDKTMGRYYLAIIDLPLKDDIEVQTNIARSPNNRLKMANQAHGKVAKTAFKKILQNKNIQNNSKKYELISAKLFTGRTHQIRVHLESLNRHILGDNLYGFKGNESNINRIYLHAYCLYLIHPISNEKLEFVANIPSNMQDLIQNNFQKDLINEKINKHYIVNCFNSTI
jgi:23S rRNA pseudouridine1911/1915/1917 synthase